MRHAFLANRDEHGRLHVRVLGDAVERSHFEAERLAGRHGARATQPTVVVDRERERAVEQCGGGRAVSDERVRACHAVVCAVAVGGFHLHEALVHMRGLDETRRVHVSLELQLKVVEVNHSNVDWNPFVFESKKTNL